jgi:hypothetical protein
MSRSRGSDSPSHEHSKDVSYAECVLHCTRFVDSPEGTVPVVRRSGRLFHFHPLLGPPVKSLRDRPRDPQHAVASPSWSLPNPLGDAGFVFDELTHELFGKMPHLRQLADREVAIFEGVAPRRRFHDAPRRHRVEVTGITSSCLLATPPSLFRDTLLPATWENAFGSMPTYRTRRHRKTLQRPNLIVRCGSSPQPPSGSRM